MLNNSREHRCSRTLVSRQKIRERAAIILCALFLVVFLNLPGMTTYGLLAATVRGVPIDKTTAWFISGIISLLVVAIIALLTPSRASILTRYAVFCAAIGSGILLTHLVTDSRYPSNMMSMYFAKDATAIWGDNRGPGYRATRSDIKEVQTLLQRLDYSPGEIDGVLGRRTQEAIIDFQRHRNIPVNPNYSAKLLQDLKHSVDGVAVSEFGR